VKKRHDEGIFSTKTRRSGVEHLGRVRPKWIHIGQAVGGGGWPWWWLAGGADVRRGGRASHGRWQRAVGLGRRRSRGGSGGAWIGRGVGCVAVRRGGGCGGLVVGVGGGGPGAVLGGGCRWVAGGRLWLGLEVRRLVQ